MLYLGISELEKIGRNWNTLVQAIGEATDLLCQKDFAQPVKPYLRYGDRTNRIIAMPAFLGGNFYMSGIKWIASFPGNIDKKIPRAHSVTILNDAGNGIPVSIINTTAISAIRTASVSGYFLHQMMKRRKPDHKLRLGITGFGPIGLIHLEMVHALFGDLLEDVSIYDVRPLDRSEIPQHVSVPVQIAGSWQEAYRDADIFITCTVSKERYINEKPKPGSLQLNVSLRDYDPGILQYIQYVVVDDWDEICRENTDIEKMHLEKGLSKDRTFSLPEISGALSFPALKKTDVVMFNPMGMAVYDIAVACHYYKIAAEKQIGVQLQ